MSVQAGIPGVEELDRDQGRALVDSEARKLLGMSLEEFEDAYDSGKLDPGNPDVIKVWMLLPFAR